MQSNTNASSVLALSGRCDSDRLLCFGAQGRDRQARKRMELLQLQEENARQARLIKELRSLHSTKSPEAEAPASQVKVSPRDIALKELRREAALPNKAKHDEKDREIARLRMQIAMNNQRDSQRTLLYEQATPSQPYLSATAPPYGGYDGAHGSPAPSPHWHWPPLGPLPRRAPYYYMPPHYPS